jgi:hypothetical protein
MNALAQSPLFWGGLIAGLVLLYILPTLIGIARKVEDLGLLIFINLLPTGVGWLAAMVMAFVLPRREPPVTYQPYNYYSYQIGQYPPVQYPQAPGGSW